MRLKYLKGSTWNTRGTFRAVLNQWGFVKVNGQKQPQRLHGYTPAEASAYGRRRGLKSGQVRRSRTQERDETIRYMADCGLSQREIAKHFELSHVAIGKVLRRGGNRTNKIVGESRGHLEGFASGDTG